MIKESIKLAIICLICNVKLEKAELNDSQLGINNAFTDGKDDFEMHYEDSWEEADIPKVSQQGKSSQLESIRMPSFQEIDFSHKTGIHIFFWARKFNLRYNSTEIIALHFSLLKLLLS